MTGPRQVAALVLLAVGAMSVATGCKVGATPKAGAGESTDICSGYREYNALRPPVLNDLDEVKRYVTSTQRVLRRIDKKMTYNDLRGHRTHAPTTVLQQVAQVKQAYAGLEGELRSVDGGAQLAGVVQRFAGSSSFESADTALELWIGSNCA